MIQSIKKRKIQSTLDLAHIEEAFRKGADFFNWGFYVGHDRIESKTTEGLLISMRNRKINVVTHYWAKE